MIIYKLIMMMMMMMGWNKKDPSDVTKGGLVLTYQNGQQGSLARQTQINLNCASTEKGEMTFVKESTSGTTRIYIFQIDTKYACIGGGGFDVAGLVVRILLIIL